MKGICISAVSSGSGKTTICAAVMAALVKRGLTVAPFKCGPDYIDTSFHRAVCGREPHNLDSFFCSPDTLRYLYARYSAGADISVTEGVMGLYDGINGEYSTARVTDICNIPVICVIDARGMSDTLGAIIKGMLTYRKNNIKGFIFNRLAPSLEGRIRQLCRELGTEFAGYLPKCDEIALESRHLGLLLASEDVNIRHKLDKMAALAEKYIDLDLIERFAADIPETGSAPHIRPINKRIAISKDAAFCFTYADNIDYLEQAGCELTYFSPLTDSAVPPCDVMYLCGGYPENHLDELSANTPMLRSIRDSIRNGLPTVAECGGFMYLHDTVCDKNGTPYHVAGAINGTCTYAGRPVDFGYHTYTANSDDLLCKKGETLRAHEFHYYRSDNNGTDFTARKPFRDGERQCIHANGRLVAGFAHWYLYGDNSLIMTTSP